ncbi:nitrate reductase molybdenum cofactor assembly chaperone [Paucibacter sp. B2R-40]|uniref:nitrate reductase molybdenum cofactor assembly chaperone n=1 Tax=Paucibacter sp. B2R-40 TaxID=2893554 RepID=UPI0021E398AB|nr:nitrate reductase molybdenum cofactor assembly chaperone [Paucibacter sp. B2R-40]MCV2356367.1 nitrate reductase molybdenum cofactor assembly chaperone [Paucibacter sp. B2R-40]
MKSTSFSKSCCVLARLLDYPRAEMRAALPELFAVLTAEGALSPARLAEMKALSRTLQQGDAYEVEARYVESFDRGRATSLHMFEHVHGDSRDRGPALIDLQQTYAAGGMFFEASELPDYLPVVLEFASTQLPETAKAFLAEMAHILNAIHSGLIKRDNPYAAAIGAVLELAGEKPQAVQITVDESLDEAWQEPAAFDGCSSKGQSKPGAPQPIHIVRKTAPHQEGVRP